MYHNKKTYFRLRFLSWVGIPMFSIGWYIFSGITHIRTPAIIPGIVIAFEAYLGLTLQISTARFSRENRKGPDGTLLVINQEDKKIFSLELNGNPEELEDEQEVVFQVKKTE